MHTVDELMSRDVTTLHVNDVVGPVRDLMQDSHIHAAPVLDDSGAVVGIVTSSDLIEEWSPQMGVLSVMSPDVATVSPHTSAADAARLMVDHRVHHLVVVQHGALVGILSSFDVMRHLATRVEQLVAAAPSSRSSGLHAQAGDVIVVRPRHLGERERRATVVQAHGEGGTAPFSVRWSDDPHDEPRLTLFFPSTDAYVERADDRQGAGTSTVNS
jgi:CBS domain-containing protein